MSKIPTFVGACNIDLISYVNALPKPGETIRGVSYEVGFGGKGANQCIAAANLLPKNNCQMISGLGDDDHGKNYQKYLQDKGISTQNIQIFENETSGVAPITVDLNSGENSIIIIPGANNRYTVNRNMVDNASMIICQNESSYQTTKHALKLGIQNRILTILNPSPTEGVDLEILNLVNILILNEHELEILTKFLDQKNANNLHQVVQNLFQTLKNLQTVIITFGGKGAQVFGNLKCEFTSLISKQVSISRQNINVVDTTGAGDCFLGSFIAKLQKVLYGLDNSLTGEQIDQKMCKFADNFSKIVECVEFACNVASVSVESRGTQKSYPELGDLEKYGIVF